MNRSLDEYIASAHAGGNMKERAADKEFSSYSELFYCTESDNENEVAAVNLPQMSNLLVNSTNATGDGFTLEDAAEIAKEPDNAKELLKPKMDFNKNKAENSTQKPLDISKILPLKFEKSLSVNPAQQQRHQRFSPYAATRNKSTATPVSMASQSSLANNVQLLQQLINKTKTPNIAASQLFANSQDVNLQTLNGQGPKTANTTSTCSAANLNATLNSMQKTQVFGNNWIDKSYADKLQLLQHILKGNKTTAASTQSTHDMKTGNALLAAIAPKTLNTNFSTLQALQAYNANMNLNLMQTPHSNGPIDALKNDNTQSLNSGQNFLQAAQSTAGSSSTVDNSAAVKIQLLQQLLNGNKSISTAANNQNSNAFSLMAKCQNQNNAFSSLTADFKQSNANKTHELLANNGGSINAAITKQKSLAGNVKKLQQTLSGSQSGAVQQLNNERSVNWKSLFSQGRNITDKIGVGAQNVNNAKQISNGAGNMALNSKTRDTLNNANAPLKSFTNGGGLNMGLNSLQGSLSTSNLSLAGTGIKLMPHTLPSGMLASNVSGLNMLQSPLAAGNVNLRNLANTSLYSQIQNSITGGADILNSFGGTGLFGNLSNTDMLLQLLGNTQQAGLNNSIMSLSSSNLLNQNYLTNTSNLLPCLNNMSMTPNDGLSLFSSANLGLDMNLNAFGGGNFMPNYNNNDIMNLNGDAANKTFGGTNLKKN